MDQNYILNKGIYQLILTILYKLEKARKMFSTLVKLWMEPISFDIIYKI